MADTVWMIDPTGDTRGTILWTSYQVVHKFRGVGAWQVTCPLTPEHALAADRGWRIHITDGADTVIAGPLEKARIVIDATNGRPRPTLVLSGTDDMLWLRSCDARPTPLAAITAQTTPYDIRTGTASTIIRQYVDVNAGPGATVTRRVPSLTLAADPVVGGTVTGRARFTPLLEVLEKLAVAGAVSGVELGYRVVSGFGLAKSFEVYLPADRSGPARFSLALRNVRSLVWELVAPTVTDMVGGGRGEEAARSFIQVSDLVDQADWGRREGFYDFRSASSTDGNAELTAGATQQLDEAGATESVDIQVVDTEQLRYGRDYGLGDIVTVDVFGGVTVNEVIREVEISANRREGKRVRPKIGTIGATGRGQNMTQIRHALARIGNLERR